MSTEQKPRTLSVPFGGAKRQGTAVVTPEGVERPKTQGMQALAAELHQAALQGVFEYPRNWLLVARTAAGLLVLLSVFHIIMVAIPLLQEPVPLAEALLNWRMGGALLGAGMACVVAAVVANIFQTIQVTPEGLCVSEVTGWRRISWKQVDVLRIMEVAGKGERYLVMIPFKGRSMPPTPAPMLRLIPAFLGASVKGDSGIVITSDMKNFERLLQLVVSYMAQEAGQVTPTIEAYVDEHVVMPVGQVLFSTKAALTRMVRSNDDLLDPYGMPVVADEFNLPWGKVLGRQAFIAALPVLLVVLDVLLRNGEKPLQGVQWLWIGIIAGLGVLELPFISRLAQTAGELAVGSGQFKRTVWAYLELQVPRVLLVMVGIGLLGLGLPAIVAQTFWLAGIVLTAVLLTRYLMRLHHMSVPQALLATLGVLIFQGTLMALYIGVR